MGVDTTPTYIEQPDVSKSCCVQWRNSAYGYRGVRVGEASNPGPLKALRVLTPQWSRSRADPTIHSSDRDEILLPGSDSRSTVPSSTGALREAGVETREFSRNVVPRVHDQAEHAQRESGVDLSSGGQVTEFDCQSQIHSAVDVRRPVLMVGAHDQESGGPLAAAETNRVARANPDLHISIGATRRVFSGCASSNVWVKVPHSWIRTMNHTWPRRSCLGLREFQKHLASPLHRECGGE